MPVNYSSLQLNLRDEAVGRIEPGNLRGHDVFKAQAARGGIYPQGTTVTYGSESLDLFESFDPQAGTFRVPFDGSFTIRFEYEMVCHPYETSFSILKNGELFASYSCMDNDVVKPGAISYGYSFKQGDVVSIHSGNADLYMENNPAVITGILNSY